MKKTWVTKRGVVMDGFGCDVRTGVQTNGFYVAPGGFVVRRMA